MRWDSDSLDSPGASEATGEAAAAVPCKLTVLPRDTEQREVQLVGADVLTLRHPGEPLLRHHPVLVVRQVQEAPRLPVQVAGLDVGRHIARAQPVVEQAVDFL